MFHFGGTCNDQYVIKPDYGYYLTFYSMFVIYCKKVLPFSQTAYR